MQLKLKKALQIFARCSNRLEIGFSLLFRKDIQHISVRGGPTLRAPRNIALWNHFNDIWLYESYTGGKYQIQEDSTVIDIGANVGVFTLLAAQKARKVFAFEPYRASFDYLLKNVSENGLDNVVAFNCAVAEGRGKRRLRVQTECTANSLWGPCSGSEVDVACITLTDIFDSNAIEFCDLLKLDCEGSEFEILFSTPEAYLRRIGRISMECHNGVTSSTHSDMQRFLESRRFGIDYRLVRGETAILRARNCSI